MVNPTDMQPTGPTDATLVRRNHRNADGLTTKQRDAKAMELRKAGSTWAQIADDLGYANGAVARRAALRSVDGGTDA